MAVQGLLNVGRAERAGIWLAPPVGQTDNWKGRVENRNRDATPPEWNRLDPSLPFLRPSFESGTAFSQSLDGRGGLEMFGPLLGMQHALWIPLRVGARTFGVALTAWSQLRTSENGDLQRIADDLSLALGQRADAESCQAGDSELAFRSQIQKNILAGVPPKQSLETIARKAVESAGCVFFELGLWREGKVHFEIYNGRSDAEPCSQEEPARQVWTKALEERRTIGTSVNAFPREPSHPTSEPGPWKNQASRLVAIPLLADKEVLGIIVSGIAAGQESLANLERLESYAILAAMALSAEARQRRESVLQASQATRLESTPDMILIVDRDGVVRNTSQAARKMLGRFAAWVGHVHLEDLFVAANRPAIAAWRRALPEDGLADAAEGVLPNGRKVRLLNRSIAPSLEAEGSVREIVLEDTSAKEREESVLDRAKAELETLLDSLESGVVIFDATGAIRHVNHSFGELFGLDRVRALELGNAKALTARLMDCFSDSEKYAAQWHEAVSGGGSGSREELALDRPTPRALERLVRPVFNRSGARIGWLEVFRDLTAQKLTHMKLQQTGKLAALGRMASGLAHELNNPLTSILGYAQLLLDPSRGAEKNSDLRKIYQQAERASHIAKNLLLFGRETRSERRPVDLNEIVRSTLSLREYELKLENIGVDSDLDPNLPPVLADPGQMQQVVLNLIVNAEQAIQEARRSGHIRIRTAKAREERVVLEVADDGPGIPPEIAANIFDPFFTTKPAGQGTGLGLSIAREIMEEFDGAIRLCSSTDSGATFQIELPAANAAALGQGKSPSAALPTWRTESAPHPAARAAESRRRRKRVLVVEDEPTVAQLIADVLQEEGHDVETLLDSRKGLDRAERQSFDLVICDLKMPQLDGQAFYAALESSRNPLQHRILFVTGDTLAAHTMEFLQTHHLPFVAKPFLVEELKRAVDSVLNPAASNARAASGVATSGWSREPVRKK
jgi:signal transduction histidine kinase/ActR/RegA family two-component response regulator